MYKWCFCAKVLKTLLKTLNERSVYVRMFVHNFERTLPRSLLFGIHFIELDLNSYDKTQTTSNICKK